MTRTHRNLKGMLRGALRRPQTFSEIRNLSGFLVDNTIEEYPISGLNHLHSRLSDCPTSWDDKVVSGYLQSDYKK
jgi:hypothetical protein